MKMSAFTNIQRVRFLYKTILKLHRGLPPELKELGTSYARDEFKRHKKCTPKEAEIFIKEWTSYALSLADQLGIKGLREGGRNIGQSLSTDDLASFRNEQIYQLYELMQASKAKDAG